MLCCRGTLGKSGDMGNSLIPSQAVPDPDCRSELSSVLLPLSWAGDHQAGGSVCLLCFPILTSFAMADLLLAAFLSVPWFLLLQDSEASGPSTHDTAQCLFLYVTQPLCHFGHHDFKT